MLKFIKNVLLFFSIIIVLFCAVIFIDYKFVGNQYGQNYQASLIDKVNRLESIDQPKIILVGNSNVAFGFRSELIEEEFGMPVVNLGLHGGLGNKFHENIAKLNINKGDIVIICHSDYSDDGKITDNSLAWITLEWNFELWKILDYSDMPDFISEYPNYMIKALNLALKGEENKTFDNAYSRKAFNKYGDNVFSDNNSGNYSFKEDDNEVPEVNATCINRINEFNKYVNKKGAALLIAGFPIADGKYTKEHTLFYEYENTLRSKVSCPVISSVDDYFMDYRYFYDTTLHLTEEGAVIRTKQLIKDLHGYLE